MASTHKLILSHAATHKAFKKRRKKLPETHSSDPRMRKRREREKERLRYGMSFSLS